MFLLISVDFVEQLQKNLVLAESSWNLDVNTGK